MWWIEQRLGDLLAERGTRRPGKNQNQREHTEGERRRVENVPGRSVSFPVNERLCRETESYYCKLPVIELGPEPEEKVDAKQDGKRPKSELKLVATSELQKRIEPVCEEQLTHNQLHVAIHGREERSPVHHKAALREHLQPVRRFNHNCPRKLSTRTQGGQVENKGSNHEYSRCTIEAGGDRRMRRHLRHQTGRSNNGCRETDREKRGLGGRELPRNSAGLLQSG